MKFIAPATLLALLASHVSAYCPNLCSGHGTCEANDKCTCYKYVGTGRGDHINPDGAAYNSGLRVAWTGADCSLRTCPLAYSWSGATPYGLSSSIALVTSVSAGDFSFKIGTADILTNKQNLSVGSKVRIVGNANTDLATIRATNWDSTNNVITTYEALSAHTSGTVYYAPSEEERTASALDAKDANGAHGMLECAGQGICDRTTGNCDCFPGYEGEACTRSMCPNDCSGNGICLSAQRLSSDAGATYTFAWDSEKHFGCKCDVGFRGPDCSLQECPSDYDPMHGCGGGECNLSATDATGNACPNASGGVTLSDCSTGEQRDCSGRGLCDYETGTCKCFSGFFGQACENQTILI